ncbi:DUF898 family protein [Rhodoplanes sp. Z2-YC6860]|uniref:DUF898 family protein n=1 Tax=Rhodoplanes sp. Z2-YC6860 TaxID=674703 RepID=UPI00078EE308|nr:DUF898 family protein [Rhodoplanes sp. Z2-YC6860]AMN42561.1 hypothetical protein RHPLAN_41300 [Rhodoplanes sp. Z2-YC6860]
MNDVLIAVFSPPVAPPEPTPATSRIVFENGRPAYRRLVMRGALLELVTVGFYRFWLATDMRRHLWSHTSVDGDAPEYTGTAKELLIGFLFALAILVPLYLTYFLLGIEAERLQAFASTPLALFYYLFIQFAVYRARRYRLTRTVWRGVRFSMGGSGLGYAWRVGLWTLLTAVTLGFALPWRQAVLERYKMRHTAYGNLAGGFVATGGGLLRRAWGLWVLGWVAVGVLASAGTVAMSLSLSANSADMVTFSLIISCVIAAPFFYGIYKAIEWRWWASGIRFGEVSFESELRSSQLIGLYWKVIGWSMLILVAVSAVVGAVFVMAFAGLSDSSSSVEFVQRFVQEPAYMAAFAVAYVAAVLAFWTVTRIYLIHDVWQRVTQSVTVHNLGAAADVAEQGQVVSAVGEGLADSLDVGGF